MISKRMDCREARDRLVALLSGELSSIQKKGLFRHLSACSACSEEKETLEKVWRDIGTLPETEIPGDLRDATISRIEKMLQIEAHERLWPRRVWENWVPKPLAALFGGVTMAFLSLWVLQRVTAFEQLGYGVIFLCAALWTGIMGGTFLFATGSLPAIGFRWQWASRIALTALGLAMLGTLLCPKMSLIQWWESLPPGQFLLGFGQGISHGAFGVIYSFLPFFVAVYVLGRRVKGELLRQAFSAGILFLILLLPAIYLQTLPLSSAVFLTWAAGSTVGVILGSLSGVGIYRFGSWSLSAGV